MRIAFATTVLTAVFMVGLVTAAPAQDQSSKLGTRTVTGTVKSTTEKAIVVRGIEKDKEREWAFSVDDKTSVRKGASPATVTAGDRVTVDYAERDGKIIAQRVTITDGASSPASRAPSK